MQTEVGLVFSLA